MHQQAQADNDVEVGNMPTFQSGGTWVSNQPPFFPPDYAYPRYLLPPGEQRYAALDAHRIKGT
jgi:hypothetical protein